MQQDLQNQIRERAYHLWLANGCRDDQSDQHWLAAEREVLAAFAAGRTPVGGKRATAKAPSKGRRAA